MSAVRVSRIESAGERSPTGSLGAGYCLLIRLSLRHDGRPRASSRIAVGAQNLKEAFPVRKHKANVAPPNYAQILLPVASVCLRSLRRVTGIRVEYERHDVAFSSTPKRTRTTPPPAHFLAVADLSCTPVVQMADSQLPYVVRFRWPRSIVRPTIRSSKVRTVPSPQKVPRQAGPDLRHHGHIVAPLDRAAGAIIFSRTVISLPNHPLRLRNQRLTH